MALNLKARLGRIRRTEVRQAESGISVRSPGETEHKPAVITTAEPNSSGLQGEVSWSGWNEIGFKTLKRELYAEPPFPLPAVFGRALAILVPDLSRMGRVPSSGDLLFFDLETTGLSGGAGTVAFLAAFGRFAPPGGENMGGSARLKITQYLLLDYPGESDFIECLTGEFSVSPPPFVVSFNGKCFDSQILKNRCLMNGIKAPEYLHLDLLHPARRLWKKMLPDCSQATIETLFPGLNRSGDVSGALAPEIWFSFLRTGENRELLTVCDHNRRDILGLASLFLALGKIAEEPLESRKTFHFDEEALALSYWEALKKNAFLRGDGESYQRYEETGKLLLETAAGNGCKRAAFALGLDLFKKGRYREGRTLMKKLTLDASEAEIPGSLRAAALKSLAIDAEWRLGDLVLALDYTNAAIGVPELSKSFRNELEKRRFRLEKKTATA